MSFQCQDFRNKFIDVTPGVANPSPGGLLYHPAEFSSNPNQTRLIKLFRIT